MYKHILLPTDGSPCSERGVREGLALAQTLEAEVTLLSVIEEPVMKAYNLPDSVSFEAYTQELRGAAQRALERAAEMARSAGVEATSVLAEPQKPALAIHEAEQAVDLVVMATHGRSGFDHMVYGSVTEGAMRRASKPYLVVRSEEGANG